MRRKGLAGAFVAVLIGVTMLTMTALVLNSARPQVPARLAAASTLIQSSVPMPPSQVDELVTRLSAIPGVRSAIPDTPVYAQAVGSPHTQGNSWATAALAPYTLTGSPPAHDGEVVVGSSLGRHPGDRITILTTAGPRDYTVSGTVNGHGIFFKDNDHLGVRFIALLTEDHMDLAQVSAIAASAKATVLTGDARSAAEPESDTYTRWIGMQVLTAMGGLSAFVAVFLVASTFAFSVLQRRRELGLLRAIGATPQQVRRMLFREALIVGALAGAAGAVLGSLLAPPMGAMLVDAGFEPPSFEVRWEPLPVAAAVVAGLTVALAGVFVASRRAGRVGPLEALRTADAERRPMTRSRWIFGGLAVAFGILLAFVTVGADAQSMPTYAGGSVMALVTGMSLLAPAFLPPMARFAVLRGAVGLLVRQNAMTAARRTASTAAPVLLTVAFGALVMGMVQTGAGAYAARRADTIPFPAALVPDGTPGLTDAAVATVPGLALLPTTVYLDGVALDAFGLSSAPEGDGLTVTPEVAAQHGWAQGQTLALTVADGQSVRMRIAAITPGPMGIAMGWKTARAYDPGALTQVVFTQSAPNTPPIGTKVVTSGEWAAVADAEEDRLVWTFTLILVGMVLGFAVIGIANTLLMATVGRRRDLMVLRRVGATDGQLLRLVATETTLVVFLGALLGGVVALAGLLAIRAGLSEQIGLPIPLAVPWPMLAVVIGGCVVVGLAASVLPARAMLRAASNNMSHKD